MLPCRSPSERRREQRWGLYTQLASAAAAQGSQESLDWWNQLADATWSKAEKLEKEQAEEEELERRRQVERQQALDDAAAAWAAQFEAGLGANLIV